MGDEPFIVFWGDEFMDATPSVTEQLLAAYEKTGSTILGGMRTTDPADFKKYGYAGGEELGEGLMRVSKIVEKPGSEAESPSNLATLAGFIFTPEIFLALRRAAEKVKPGQELVYVDGLNVMMENGAEIYAQEIQNSEYHDCGSRLGYLKTIVDLALRHEDLKGDFKEYLRSLDLK